MRLLSLWMAIPLTLLLIPACAASPVISEVFYDAEGSDDGLEFIELYNPTGETLDLAGWKIEWGNGASPGEWKLQAALSAQMPPYSFYLVGEANVSGADLTTNLELQNGPDAVRLLDSGGLIADLVGYGDQLAFSSPEYYETLPFPQVSPGHSVERKPGYLSPLAGNGQDTNNNSADLLERDDPEPQNSSFTEFQAVSLIRTLTPAQQTYLPSTRINVTLAYSFFLNQVGIIVSETISSPLENADPQPDHLNHTTGLMKWLAMGAVSLPNQTLTYSFLAPDEPGTYPITGGWQSVSLAGAISQGAPADALITVISGSLTGFVEDVFGSALPNATIALPESSTLTAPTGSYSLSLPGTGVFPINASKQDYLPEAGEINTSSLPGMVFNFTGSRSLVPEQVDDTRMLLSISRWAQGFLDDDKVLEVVHQWAATP